MWNSDTVNIILVMVALLFSQLVSAGEQYTKIDSSGAELLDTATEWACVKNNITGQLWEVKTDLNRDEFYTFSEVKNYVTYLNNLKFCGYADWRLPSVKELNGLIHIVRKFPIMPMCGW